MTETVEQKAARYAEQRRRKAQELQAWECKQINRQLRSHQYREQLAAKIIKGGVL